MNEGPADAIWIDWRHFLFLFAKFEVVLSSMHLSCDIDVHPMTNEFCQAEAVFHFLQLQLP